MSGNRLTIFDTTLRDGEQAPGFSLRIDEKLKLARQLRALGRGHHRGGVPDCVRGGCRGGPHGRHPRPGRSIAALARCRAEGHRARRLGAHAGAATAHPRLHRHVGSAPRAQAAHDARGVPARRHDRGPARAAIHRRRAVLGGGRDAQRSGFPVAGRRSGDPVGRRRRSTFPIPSATRRRTRSRDFFAAIINRVPSSDQVTFSAHCHDDLGLAVGEHACGAHRRRAPGRVHDQRHRRARRQRVARGGRDGHSGARRIACRSRPASTRRRSIASSQLLTALTGEGVQANKAIVGPQRVRARSRHPPGRHAEGSPHLRNHAARRGRRPAGDAGARQAFRPSCRAAPLRADRLHARQGHARCRSIAPSSRMRTARRSSAIAISRPS